MSTEIEVIKKANTITHFTHQQLLEYAKCIQDPLYFIKNYTYVQHPIKGKMLFEPYPYQQKMIETFNSYKKVIACTGRQQGKSLVFNSIIKKDDCQIKIGKIFKNFSIKTKIINWLENILLYCAKKT